MFVFRSIAWGLLSASIIAQTGCEAERIIDVQGTVLRDGAPIVLGPTGALQVTLIPDVAAGEDYTTYVGRCDAAGKFEVTEVPAGRYKVAIQQFDPDPVTDALRGRFAQDKTKFVFDLQGKEPVTIDLAK